MLTRWAPFDLVDRAERDFDDVIRRTFGELGTRLARQQQQRVWAPPLDVFTKDDQLHVRLELPGIDPDQDLEIEVTDGVLRIAGDRRREEETSDEGYFRRELTYGHFERAIALPDGVDAEQVQAGYDAGILHITVPLPKKPSSKVKVAVGGGTQQRQLNE